MIELNKTDGIAVLTMNSPAQCHVGQADAGTDRGILAVERCRNCGSVFFRLGGSPRLFTRLVWIPTEAGRGFRFDVGHRSDMKPATLPI